MKLYNFAAPNPRRVRIFIAEKGLDVTCIEVNTRTAENLQSEFLQINPRGVIPTLELDDGSVLDESVAICRYLEALQPEPNLLGLDGLECARIEACQRHMEFDGLLPLLDAFRNTHPVFAERGVPGLPAEFKAIPELAKRGQQRFHLFLKKLDTQLSENEYVFGNKFTIADITAFVAIEFAKLVKVTDTEDREHISRWLEQISKRPSAKM